MVRRKNIEIKERISDHANHLFIGKGLTYTTYSRISEASGITRELVQYHYPKKQMLVLEFFRKLLVSIDSYLEKTDRYTDNQYVNLFIESQCYYAYLLQNEELKKLFIEVLRDRELTDEILIFNSNWSIDYLAFDSELDRLRLTDVTLLRTGGLYDYIYHSIKVGKEPNVSKNMIDIIVSLAKDFDADTPDLPKLLQSQILNEEEKTLVVSQLNAAMRS